MKKKMFIAGMSLAIALVLLATASFAWFTISTQPEVSGMNMALYSDRTLLLAAGDGTDTAPDSDDFNQYISLSSDFAGLAPLRPVSTADGINWFLPAYNTADGTLSEVGNFILDDSLEYANVSVVDASGQPLTGDALLAAQSRGYYVYTDIWMKTEEDGAKVRLSIPHSVGTTEERHAGTVTEYGLDAEELTKAVYGTYVLGEPELEENDSNKLKVRTEEPETALRVGFLIYQDSETLEPIAEDSDAALCFKIFEPNANKRAAGLSQDLWIPGSDGSTEVTREQYIAGSTVSTLQSNTYYVTQPIAKSENGQITLTTVPAENMIVQLSSEWDETAVVKTMNGLWGNSITKPSSNDVKTFGQFIKLNDAFATANNVIDLSDLTDMTDIAGNNLVVELKKDTPIRVRLFVWLEGQDVDCWNDIATGTFRINLELAGESVVKPEAGDEPGGEYTLSNDWASYSEKNGFTSLTFTRDIPSGYDRTWNVGADDGVVNAYACGSDAYIVVPQNGILYLPQNCNKLFAMRFAKTITGFDLVDTSRVTNMGSMFNGCICLTGLDLSSFDTSSVTNMNSMFRWCDDMTTLDVSSFDTSKVRDMAMMFCPCSRLTELDVTGFDTSSVKDMDSMFGGCKALTELDVTGFDTSSVTDMYNMFGNMNVAELDLSSFDTSSVMNMDHMFSFSSVQTIYVSDKWNTAKVTSDEYMFYNSPSLVGGNGTTYDPAHKDSSYARIDKPGQPGYFTEKNATPAVTCTLKGCGTDSNGSDSWFYSSAANISKDQVTAIEFTKTVPTGSTKTWNAGTGTGDDAINAYLVGTKVYIVVPDGADKIMLPADSKYLFKDMTALTSIDGAEYLDTSNVMYMNGMFGYCTNLTSVDVSNWNTSKVEDMYGVFYGSNLVSVDVSNWNTSKVTNMSYAFSSCNKLEDLDVSNWDTSSVTNMEGMFYNSTALTELDVSDWDTSKVTNMQSLFESCTSLTELDLSNWNTSNVTNMYSMFYECTGLTELDVNNWDTSKVTNMQGLFLNLEKLQNLDVSSWDTSSVTNMDWMFGYTGLTTIYASDKFTTSAVTTAKCMFFDCSSLVGGNGTKYSASYINKTHARIDKPGQPGYFTDKNAPKTVTCTLKGYGTDGNSSDGWFDSSKAGITRDQITALEFVKSVPTGYTATWDAGTSSGIEAVNAYLTGTVVSIVLPNGADKIMLPENSECLFQDMTACTSIDGAGYLDTSNVTSMRCLFAGCTNLASIDVSNWNTSNAENMEYMFYFCEKLAEVNVSNWNTSNVTNIRWMFCQCTGLTELDINNWNTSKVTNAEAVFIGCENLTQLDVSNWDTSNVTNMKRTFAACSSLTELDVRNWNTSNISNMYGMFFGCVNLTGLSLSSFDTSSVTNMEWMFYNCSNLLSLDVSNFDTSAVSSMSFMFKSCGKLTGLDLSNFDTSSVMYMEHMFEDCNNLATIYVGSGWNISKVTEDSYMFNNCSALVGGNGTKYSKSYINKTYARIDGGTASPGYFTAK